MSPGPIDRIRQTRRLLQTEGASGVATRIGNRVARKLSPPDRVSLDIPRDELMRAAEIAAAGWELPPLLPHTPGEPLTIAWVSVATGGFGSGGHTTMLRHIEALERAGHRCVLYFTDRHGWSIEQHRRMIRDWWPSLKAEVRDAADGIEDAHAIFATSWPTAYTVLASPARGKRFYLVMDFEPWFYPQGSEALLAEATYRFGFHGVTGGRWLVELMQREYGMSADSFDFACDLDLYNLDPEAERTGICYYARYSKPRRAFEIGMLALELFAEMHPEVDIHLYGDSLKHVPFRAINHGTMTPAELNGLYNRCVAGLVLSATNVSLVPHEMLAAGCIPVVNDNEFGRIVLDNDEVAYAGATPFELANALSALVTRSSAERAAAARAAADSVEGRSWHDEGDEVERIIRSVIDGVTVA